ncbi:MAG: hypothetical protein ABIU05_14125 [Nitrospirales bacterium]
MNTIQCTYDDHAGQILVVSADGCRKPAEFIQNPIERKRDESLLTE